MTHVGHKAWFIDFGYSFHVISHRHWFSVYEKYDHGMVFISDDSPLCIVGCGRVFIRFHEEK
jgi:hypothetical protein